MKAYETDWSENSNAWKRKCQKDESKKILNKLTRHFKLGKLRYEFSRCRNSGTSYTSRGLMKLPKKDISLGLINHEIAHFVTDIKYSSRHHHDKKFMKCLKLVNNYVRKKHYFDNFIDWKIDRKGPKSFWEWTISITPEHNISESFRMI